MPSPWEFIGARGGAFAVEANIRSEDENTFDFTNELVWRNISFPIIFLYFTIYNLLFFG